MHRWRMGVAFRRHGMLVHRMRMVELTHTHTHVHTHTHMHVHTHKHMHTDQARCTCTACDGPRAQRVVRTTTSYCQHTS